jgi:hypothetical protein
VFKCLFLLIPATNFDDTKRMFDDHATNLVMYDLPMTEIRNDNFGQSYYDSSYLNHVTLYLQQDWNTRPNCRNSLK